MPTCGVPSLDHKKNFDEAMKKLTSLRKEVEKAETLAEVSEIEKNIRNALMEVIHRANFLSYWMKEAADKRRKEIKEGE